MKTLFALSVALATTTSTFACGDYASLRHLLDCSGHVRLTLDDLTRDAVGTDNAKAENAIRMLRARGPEGLRALLDANASILKPPMGPKPFGVLNLATPTLIGSQPDKLVETERPAASSLRVKAALDAVSGQRDCYASKLYWYTDFEQAKAAAKAQAKPILSLRLLGKLDEEFSCANSRFFRTTLYANAEVSQYLRDHFVLHWKSVRPVPRVTIDFGDGRKLERTITGNSIHYILAADGSLIDALPGLYGPKAFLQGLNRAEEVGKQTAAVEPEKRSALLAEYHRARIAALNAELEADLQKVSPGDKSNCSPITLASFNPSTQLPSTPIDDATWLRIADLHQETSRLDAASRTLISAKNPTAAEAGRAALTKAFVENPLLRQIRNLERSISEDTCRNEYLLHPQIHAWLSAGQVTDVDNFNRRVYAELFLTPDSDPWLGLSPNDTFSALQNNGVAQASGDSSKTQTITALGL